MNIRVIYTVYYCKMLPSCPVQQRITDECHECRRLGKDTGIWYHFLFIWEEGFNKLVNLSFLFPECFHIPSLQCTGKQCQRHKAQNLMASSGISICLKDIKKKEMWSVYPRMKSVSPQSWCLGFCVLPIQHWVPHGSPVTEAVTMPSFTEVCDLRGPMKGEAKAQGVFGTKHNDKCSSSMGKRTWGNWIYICVWYQTLCFSIRMQQSVGHFSAEKL